MQEVRTRSYTRVTAAVAGVPWAIAPEKLDTIVEILELRSRGLEFTPEEIQARLGASSRPVAEILRIPLAGGEPEDLVPSSIEIVGDGPQAAAPQQRSRGRQGSIALIPVFGTIAQRMSLLQESSGGVSIERLKARFREALDDESVKAIVLDFDSPGGVSYGCTEFAQEIYDARGRKPIVGVIDSLGASACYWIASQCPELVVTPGGLVGSIGVYMLHVDYSAQNEMLGVKPTYISFGQYKTDGNPDEPLSESAHEELQTIVNDVGNRFTQDVARGRGVPVEKVLKDFGQGRVFTASQAKAAGMVDRIQTLDQVLARLGATSGKEVQRPAEEAGFTARDDTPAPAAADGLDEAGQKRLIQIRTYRARNGRI